LALEEFTESQLIEKLPWIPWCHCELKSKPASLSGSLLSGSPKNIAYLQRLTPLVGTKKKFYLGGSHPFVDCTLFHYDVPPMGVASQ